jgi:Zn-dependent M28 family amino/carboxypeptidase
VRKRRRWPYWFLATLLALGTAAVLIAMQPTFGVGPEVQAMVQADRLRAHVKMLAETLVPRDHTHVENLDRAAAYIHGELAATGAQVSEQPFVANGRTYRNVIATYGPRSGERIVVGAHYDAFEALPAADDNASGVAGLIELGRLLGAEAPKMRTELVAYTLEEPPYFDTDLMGSSVHARTLKKERLHVRAMLSLEMIGYFSDAPHSQSFPTSLLGLLYPTTGNYITVIGRIGGGSLVRKVKKAMRGATPLPVHSMNGPRFLPGIDFSDHASYWDEGFPAAMITDTAFYRNDRYHTARDTPDTLDYDRMGMVVKGVYAAVKALAE